MKILLLLAWLGVAQFFPVITYAFYKPFTKSIEKIVLISGGLAALIVIVGIALLITLF